MNASLEQRLTELEVRLSFVDDALGTLNDTVAMHDRGMLALRNALEALRIDLMAVRGTLGQAAQDEPPPPHY